MAVALRSLSRYDSDININIISSNNNPACAERYQGALPK